MFALGRVFIGDYILWITTSVFEVSPLAQGAEDQSYYEVSLSRKEDNSFPDGTKFNTYYYINLAKSYKFLLELDDKGFPTAKSDKIEVAAYLNRKEMPMPNFLLSKKKIETLISNIMVSSMTVAEMNSLAREHMSI